MHGVLDKVGCSLRGSLYSSAMRFTIEWCASKVFHASRNNFSLLLTAGLSETVEVSLRRLLLLATASVTPTAVSPVTPSTSCATTLMGMGKKGLLHHVLG